MFLITGVLLAVCVSLVLSIRPLFAERGLRFHWSCWALGAGVVSATVVVLGFLTSGGFDATLSGSLMIILSVLLVVQSWMTKRSLLYMKSIHDIDGVSIIDPLTGVYNRFYLEQRLDAEIARSHRYNVPLALVAAEIHNFKLFKDEFGYQVGEIAVQRLAEQFVSELRETDVVVRYSDGQFFLVLPDTPEGNTQALVKRIENAVCGLVVVEGAGVERSIRVNVNFGLSHCVIDTQSAAELIDSAFDAIETRSKRVGAADIVETIGVV